LQRPIAYQSRKPLKNRYYVILLLQFALLSSCSISRQPAINLQSNNLIAEQELQKSKNDALCHDTAIDYMDANNNWLRVPSSVCVPTDRKPKWFMQNSSLSKDRQGKKFSLGPGLNEMKTYTHALLKLPSYTAKENKLSASGRVNALLILFLSFLLIAIILTILLPTIGFDIAFYIVALALILCYILAGIFLIVWAYNLQIEVDASRRVYTLSILSLSFLLIAILLAILSPSFITLGLLWYILGYTELLCFILFVIFFIVWLVNLKKEFNENRN